MKVEESIRQGRCLAGRSEGQLAAMKKAGTEWRMSNCPSIEHWLAEQRNMDLIAFNVGALVIKRGEVF